MPKRSIRSQFLAERKSLAIETCVGLSEEIQQRFIESCLLQDAGCIALYAAIHNEVSTHRVAGHILDSGKRLVYPRMNGSLLDFVEIASLDELAPGAMGVPEPQGDKHVPVIELDLVVVPGVVFDLTGHRLGYGRGYYDRALDACRTDCLKIGFAFDSQVTDRLPALEHDRTLSMLMTEKRTLNFNAC